MRTVKTARLELAVFAALLMLSSCAAPTPTPAATAAPTSAAATGPTVTPSSVPTTAPAATPAPSGDLQGLPVQEAPGLFVQRQIKPGDTVVDNGAYFLRTATGEIESWALAGDEGQQATYPFISADNRWLAGYGHTVRGLLDRRTGRAYRWTYARLQVLAAQGERLVFADGEHIWLAPAGLQAALALDLRPDAPGAALSPDGTRLLLLNGGTLYQVNTQSGALRAVAQPPQPAAGAKLYSSTLRTARRGQEALLVACYQGTGQHYTYITTRFSWQGEKLGEVPGRCSLSRDGRLVAWEEDLDGVSPAVVVAEAEGLRPLLRAKGAALCFNDMALDAERWLADGSGLVVAVRQGYKLLTLDGQLRELPGSAGPNLLEVLPAPDRADLFAVSRTQVVDRNGTRLAGATLGTDRERSWPAHEDPWGQDSTELRFSLPHLGHGGFCGETYFLPAAVDRAPFAPLALVVGLPANDCVQLREQPGAEARALTCLPGGTRVVPAPSQTPPADSQGAQWALPAGAWRNGEYWLRVRTAAGLEGWVAAGAGNLAWAS